LVELLPVGVGAVPVKTILPSTALVMPRLEPAASVSVEPAARDEKLLKLRVATDGVVPGLTVMAEPPAPRVRLPTVSVELRALVPVMVMLAPLRVMFPARVSEPVLVKLKAV